MFMGILSFVALLQLQLLWVYNPASFLLWPLYVPV